MITMVITFNTEWSFVSDWSQSWRYKGHSHYGPGQACTRLSSGRLQTAAFSSATWTRFKPEVWPHHHSKCIISLLYFQTTALCSRLQLKYSGMWSALRPALDEGRAWLASIPGQPSVSTLSCTRPMLSPEIFAGVNGPTEAVSWTQVSKRIGNGE